MNLYAVRIKQWVEIREGGRKPRKIVTTARRSTRRVPLSLHQVIHEGGVVIKVVHLDTFYNASLINIPDQEARLIPKSDPFHAYLKDFHAPAKLPQTAARPAHRR